MKTPKKFYIKERDNYQHVYFVACGRLSATAVRNKEHPLHGSNTMHAFDTQEAYEARLAELRAAGETVQIAA